MASMGNQVLSTGALSWQTRGMTLRERLEFRRILIPFSECWYWAGHHDKDGYASIAVDGRTRHAHRVSYEEYIGPVPDGLQLDHTCRNRGCINPRHVEPVTGYENQHRSPITSAGRQVCKRGHAAFRIKGKARPIRRCEICQRETNWGRKKVSEVYKNAR